MNVTTSYCPASCGSRGRSIALRFGLSLSLAIAPSLLRSQSPQAPALQAQTPQASQTLAFPGAEGYGATATGGRGKAAIAVTTLADDGPGSFRDAARHPGATIVFKVSGVIHLKSNITLAARGASADS